MPLSVPPAAVRDERLRDLYGRRGPSAFVASGLMALVAIETVAVMGRKVDPGLATAWLAAMLLMHATIASLIAIFHARPRETKALRWFGGIRVVLEGLHGLLWGIALLVLHIPGEVVTMMLCLVAIVGLVSAVTAGLAVHPPTLIAFTLGSLGGVLASLLLLPRTPVETYALVVPFATGGVVLANGWRMSLLYDESIRLRLAQAAQIDERRRLQDEAEAGRRAAEQAAIERARFFGAASHDLRQPVHALGLYASLLDENPPARRRRELMAAIRACVDTLDRLFHGILSIAQAAELEGGAGTRVEAQALLERVAESFRASAELRGLRLRVRPSPGEVKADPLVLERVLVNLVGNAVKYTETGGVLLAARRRAGCGQILVADTGVGIAPADRGRVFEPFFRTARGAAGPDGFGLGLATVAQLCESNGWRISVRSRPGRGSVFRIDLPEDAEPAGAPAARVLIVAADGPVRREVEAMVGAWGLTGLSVETLEAAEACLSAGGGWRVLVDGEAAGPCPVRAAVQLAEGRGERVKVAVMSDVDVGPLQARGRAEGVVVLPKPAPPIMLRTVLDAGLGPTGASPAH